MWTAFRPGVLRHRREIRSESKNDGEPETGLMDNNLQFAFTLTSTGGRCHTVRVRMKDRMRDCGSLGTLAASEMNNLCITNAS
jgi:hypothetical protein